MEETGIQRSTSIQSRQWSVCGRRLPRDEIVFFTQVVLIYIVVIVCLVNLSLGIENTNLWVALLSGSLGYLLPAPKLHYT